MNYLPAVDGLRAIAILLVLMYHGGLSYFPSGFIGVDIFFVISGFLITELIHQQLKQNCFSMINFYYRRLWRLQPVFIVFLVVISLLSLIFLLPDDLMFYVKSLRKVSLFVANQFFNRVTTGYFSPDTQQLSLLHTWSLAIEWQCYLLLPVLIYFLYRLLAKRLWLGILLLTLLSFGLTLYYSNTNPAQTYFQYSSRLFEFLIGALVALTPLKSFNGYQLIFTGLTALGLTVIVYIAHLDAILLGYPNFYALMVCIASAIIILAIKLDDKSSGAKILAFKPLVGVGFLSYSLYLWHWPIFALFNYYHFAKTGKVSLAAYGITLLLSYVSWKFIEQPCRKLKQYSFKSTVMILVIIPIIGMHLIAYGITSFQGIPQRFDKRLTNIYQKLEKYANPHRPLCISHPKTTENQCWIGKKAVDGKKGLLIGDSFSNHAWNMIDVLAKKAEVSVLAQATSSCLALPGVMLYDWWYYKNQMYKKCYQQTKRYYQMIKHNHYDYVIIGQFWGNYLGNHVINKENDKRSLDLTKTRVTRALEQALQQIINSGAKPVIIKTSALMPVDFYQCFFNPIKLHQPYDSKKCRFQLTFSSEELWFNQLFLQMKQKYPQLIFIDSKKVQCKKGICRADIKGVPIYRDSGHQTDYASYHLGKEYLSLYPNPFS